MPLAEQRNRPWRKTLLRATACGVLAVLLAAVGFSVYACSLVPALFRLNRQCQEEGYYMAEFEFRMLGLAYQLDRGRYAEAFSGLHRLHQQLKSRQGLIKVPKFSGKREELEFFLSLQNPRTGAFMADPAPYCSYDGPTQNVLLHLDALAREAGQPLRLKHPLRYLDDINTPSKLTAYLEDVSHAGWLAARLPATSFHFARELLGYVEPDNVVERNHLYAFSPEWKQTMLAWFHASQDPETGLWGPRSRWSGKLITLDLHNTSSIVKAFVDGEGRDRYPAFRLRYKPQLFASALKVMSRPLPDERDLHRWHQWSLTMGKGVDLLTRHLWADASTAQRAVAVQLIEQYLSVKFERYFITGEGAFCYYPGSAHATLEGVSSGVGIYFELGAFSAERRQKLWGGDGANCADSGLSTVSALSAADLAPVLETRNVNSIRYYTEHPGPDGYASAAAGVFYPRPPLILDAVELVPRLLRWLEATPQSMGNWVSKQELSDRLRRTRVKWVPVARQNLPLAELNRLLKQHGTLTLIGFDGLQIPRRKIAYRAADFPGETP